MIDYCCEMRQIRNIFVTITPYDIIFRGLWYLNGIFGSSRIRVGNHNGDAHPILIGYRIALIGED